MAVKKINCSSISGLPANSTKTLTVSLINQLGQPVVHPNVYQNQTFVRTAPPFKLNFALGNGNYNIPNVRFVIKIGSAVIWTSEFFTLAVTCGLVEETTVIPSWIQKLSYTSDINTHEFSLHTLGDLDIELNIRSLADPQPSGVSQDNLVWNQNVWIPGSTVYAMNGFNKVYRLNPISLGAGGVLKNTSYQIRARRVSNPAQVFLVTTVTSNDSQPAPVNLFEPTAPPVTTTQAPVVTTTQQPPVSVNNTLEAFILFN